MTELEKVLAELLAKAHGHYAGPSTQIGISAKYLAPHIERAFKAVANSAPYAEETGIESLREGLTDGV